MNRVTLFEKTYEVHTRGRHEEDLAEVRDIQASVMEPDRIRESLDPVIGTESCIFEKSVGESGILLHVPVIYDGVTVQSPFTVGNKSGRVMTAFYPDPSRMSRNVGKVIWTAKTGLTSDHEKSS